MKKIILFLLLMFSFSPLCLSNFISVNPDNYTLAVPLLKAGDTLYFESGVYTNHLKIANLSGTSDKPIVFLGSKYPNPIVFRGTDPNRNLISLQMCSFITISNFYIDVNHLMIDGIKAEGSPSDNTIHDLIIEDCSIYNVGDGTNQQIVGINNKAKYTWNWTIRRNYIGNAGTGMYLGNSDGNDGMVNFLIEYNFVEKTIGYNIEIKHENDSLRTAQGMPKSGRHILRYNVWSKDSGSTCDPNLVRPNVLVGGFPISSDGKDDWYEIYGNLFYQNPCEALFQGTSNIAFHHNILINDTSGRGFTSQSQNNRKPKNILFFSNTAILKNDGISIYSADTNFMQIATGNLILSPSGLFNFKEFNKNITAKYITTLDFFKTYTPFDLSKTDLYPLPNTANGLLALDSILISHIDFAKDFNGNIEHFNIRGAYSGEGSNPCWHLAEMIRPTVDTCYTLDVKPNEYPNSSNDIKIYPNPIFDKLQIQSQSSFSQIQILDIFGNILIKQDLTNSNLNIIDLESLNIGVYFILLSKDKIDYKFGKIIKN